MNILNLKNITYSSNDTEILKDISLEVKKGDCISIIGESGSGKSTLLKLCADLLPLSSGDIYFEGKSYENLDPTVLRKNISYCIQLPVLFGKLVYDNLEFPFKIRNEKIDMIRINALLKEFNLGEDILNKDINSLSGGEKQRIAIIRNLCFSPKVLLLDEATSALDFENAKIVENYVEKLNREGVTVLWITHSLSQSEGIFNKRLVLSKGELLSLEVLK